MRQEKREARHFAGLWGSLRRFVEICFDWLGFAGIAATLETFAKLCGVLQSFLQFYLPKKLMLLFVTSFNWKCVIVLNSFAG